MTIWTPPSDGFMDRYYRAIVLMPDVALLIYRDGNGGIGVRSRPTMWPEERFKAKRWKRIYP